PRNLERRLELMTPIFDEHSRSKLAQILKLQLSDNDLAYELDSEGRYRKIALNEAEKINNSQQILEEYISRIFNTLKKDTDHSRAAHLATKLFRDS
ncbi:RNA degradosome polyphosphate kinase, partial [Campylobacter lari]